MDELAALNYQRLTRDHKLVSDPEGNVLAYLQLQDENGISSPKDNRFLR